MLAVQPNISHEDNFIKGFNLACWRLLHVRLAIKCQCADAVYHIACLALGAST